MHKVLTDHIGKIISVPFPPQRIVSVVPSQTELLYDLGLEEQVVGITKFCEYPAHWHRSKTRIGGTKNLNIEKIKALEPDLIIANKEIRRKMVEFRFIDQQGNSLKPYVLPTKETLSDWVGTT